MLEILFLIIGCYALAALSVHLAYRARKGKKESGKHYVLVADDKQNNIEWYVRSMFSFSRRMGTDVRLTIVDQGVNEETKTIVDRLAKDGSGVKVHPKDGVSVSGKKGGKRSHSKELDGTQLLWLLEAEGVVSQADHAVLIDLQNPADLSKMPF
ncbi:hypothetical protein L1N85_07845 [Paenibacillus alkaliterrae]|uniref:hypothetical protein n=1 Tax=Paenibacillus alkaliterrae TaxID=320909 RepID=UPI001F3DA8F0|nr:hypothetical protein [Paenibacillus alkaliterrae]MCF2938345.1 hypothetical protein [Paenibacillus alkaliterrae]